jgi:hypothetical protein
MVYGVGHSEMNMGSIHLIRIPDKDARVRAIQAFLDVHEMWMSFPGDLFGVSGEHLAALTKSSIPFEDASKSANGNTRVQS